MRTVGLMKTASVAVAVLINFIVTLGQDTVKKLAPVSKRVFSYGKVHFRNDFSGAKLNHVRQTGSSTFKLVIEPENTPINKSGWYAFKAWADSPTDVTVSFTYTYGSHRYVPKVSRDGKQWRVIEKENVINGSDSAVFKLLLSQDTLWVAAQEIIRSKDVMDWVDSLDSAHPKVSQEVIGRSIEGRPIVAMRMGSTSPGKVLVVLSRQHPPEVTGQLAMKAFIEQLSNDTQFLNSYSVIAIPLINPDGVENGHWRHNMGGVDLNRDWAEFRQPETRAVKEFLESRVSEGDSIRFALDFHSTREDVFYIVADDKTSLTQRWISSLHNTIPDMKLKQTFHGVESATSKNWIYKRFGAEAVTYEVGDETDRQFLRNLGKNAAICLRNELMEQTD